MTERLQKILSARGIASRRASESMIEAGRVTVNGVVAKLGQLADPETDTIFVDGRPLPSMTAAPIIFLEYSLSFGKTECK